MIKVDIFMLFCRFNLLSRINICRNSIVYNRYCDWLICGHFCLVALVGVAGL